MVNQERKARPVESQWRPLSVESQWRPLAGSAQAIALEVLVNGPLARSELARRVNLSQQSLTRLANPLVESGLLVETVSASDGTRMGRPTRPLDIVPTSHHFVGIKLTGDSATGVATTLRADGVATRSAVIEDHDPAAVTMTVARMVRELAQEVPDVSGIGITIGGDAPDGSVVVRSPFLGWTNVPLRALVEEATQLPVVVENDLIALMEAERWFGVGRETDTFALVTIGAGVGFGLLIKGMLVLNDDVGTGRIGRVGHHIVGDSGPRCAAGHRGCVTAMLTTGGIQGAVSAGLGRWVTYEEVLDLAHTGHPVAAAVIEDAARGLGRLLATVADFTMVPTVVLAGEGATIADRHRRMLDETLTHSRDPEAAPVAVVVRRSDFIDWARGAAVVAIQSFVSAPERRALTDR